MIKLYIHIYIRDHHIVGENNIGAPKMRINFGAIINVLMLLVKLSLLILIFCIVSSYLFSIFPIVIAITNIMIPLGDSNK